MLTLSPAFGQNDLQEKINHTLEEARPALMAHLRNVAQGTSRIGELALLMLAAIHDGVEPTDPVFETAQKRLAKAMPAQTYDLALRLMVLEALPAFPDRLELAQADAKELLRHRDRGAFTYQTNGNRWDLSNTQYAALGLRSAKAIGVTIDKSVWNDMAREIGSQQNSYGGFAYQARNRGFDPEGYASMTAAGIAVLAICRQAVDGDDKRDAELDKKIARGWEWFRHNLATIGSTTERWSFYFHYGLERAAILTDVTKIGTVDWYEKGARMFVDAQQPGGGWDSRTDGYNWGDMAGKGNSVATAFAVLFLRRKFQKSLGPVTPRPVMLAAVGPTSGQKDIESCTAELVRRGVGAMPDVLKALRCEVEPRRRAASVALVAIAGEGFGYDPALDAEQNREALRKAELWYLRNRKT
ncbi:MAG TPA: prenyltransferase/squalene oxidase repeat-containing protein [Planctomycetota bacterium]